MSRATDTEETSYQSTVPTQFMEQQKSLWIEEGKRIALAEHGHTRNILRSLLVNGKDDKAYQSYRKFIVGMVWIISGILAFVLVISLCIGGWYGIYWVGGKLFGDTPEEKAAKAAAKAAADANKQSVLPSLGERIDSISEQVWRAARESSPKERSIGTWEHINNNHFADSKKYKAAIEKLIIDLRSDMEENWVNK